MDIHIPEMLIVSMWVITVSISASHYCLSRLTHPVCVEISGPTWVQGLVAPLHDGTVDTRDQPGAQHAARQKPQDAVAQTHDHVVEEEEVVEVVEGPSAGDTK